MSDNQENKHIHPLVAGAAVSVILASLVGVAAMTGILPSSNSTTKQDVASATSASNVASTAVAISASGAAVPASSVGANLPPSEQQAVGTVATSTIRQNNASNASQSQNSPQAQKVCQSCGIVESIRAVEQQEAQSSGLGAVAGAVLGGVLGHQVGNGNGRTLATVAGAVGGGYAGNAVEKRTHTNTVYEVKVKMDNGHYRTFNSTAQPTYHEGEHVHINHGNVVAD
ncbi:glycine zipper 2TM domain-containing protein [Undibacterium sp. RuRC25W]|uniref:glycine zipper 2TM domain-containing protein n=1 Tax=Undibacterium sp. RuRC25W TaxID=3413047 RepID=UPI003BF1E81A